MRTYHRYLGYFLAGIMAVYAISGTIMIFRSTDFLKAERQNEKKLTPGLTAEEVGRELRIREMKVESPADDNIMRFANGSYNKETGLAVYTTKELPFVVNKLTQLHKASTNSPLFYLNVFFGLSLLFFVVSSFWMFLPKTEMFRKGLFVALAGLIVTLILVFV